MGVEGFLRTEQLTLFRILIAPSDVVVCRHAFRPNVFKTPAAKISGAHARHGEAIVEVEHGGMTRGAFERENVLGDLEAMPGHPLALCRRTHCRLALNLDIDAILLHSKLPTP